VLLIFVLVKGHWTSSKTTRMGADIPAFLANTTGMDYTPADLVSRVTSFPLVKLDPTFIKSIPYERFGNAFIKRFFMGAAGYRLLAASIKYQAIAKNESHDNILAWIYERLTEPVSLKILPLTRPKKLIELGSLNTALISLMYEVYTDQQRSELVKTGALTMIPDKPPNGINLWTIIIKGDWESEPIFEAKIQRMEGKTMSEFFVKFN